MARGSPSSRRQISATATALSGVSAKSGLTASARATKSRTASDVATSSTLVLPIQCGETERGDRELALPREPQPDAAGHQHRQRGTGAKQVGDEWCGLDHLLEVVEHQQVTLVPQNRLQPVEQCRVARFPHAERRDDGGRPPDSGR